MIKVDKNTITIDTAIVSLEDKDQFKSAFARLKNEGYKEILINLVETCHLPSEFIGILIDKKRQFHKSGIVMKIVAINDSLKQKFDAIKISEFLGL